MTGTLLIGAPKKDIVDTAVGSRQFQDAGHCCEGRRACRHT